VLAVIHASASIEWQRAFAPKVAEGLRKMGVESRFTSERKRTSEDLAILLGTTLWRSVESTGPYLLVDRCSFGDTNRWVTLVRDGHGRRGDLRVSEGVCASRWEKHQVPVQPWRNGSRVVLCGQCETYSPHFDRLPDWYSTVRATHFRKHPAGDNPTGLPDTRKWTDVGQAITLNSSVAVDAVMAGIPTVTMDEGSMAWDVTSHDQTLMYKPARTPWLHWLAWTQWTHDEIQEGIWDHYL
jgi:hypothetical protein